MSVTVLVGAQWGDEGKGKVSCYLARHADLVARFSGGNNAGHTVVIEGKEFKLQLIPSGVFYPDKLVLLGSGMVIDPAGLLDEMEKLQKGGHPCANVRISALAHLVLPYHREIDKIQEQSRGKFSLGTTQKGVGPAYSDKSERIGIRVGDLLDEKRFLERLQFNVEVKKNRFQGLNGHVDVKAIAGSYQEYAKRLKPLIVDTSKLIHDAIAKGKSVLCEGAQGMMLDLDFGTYPYVTSSVTTAGGVTTGLGIPPAAVTDVYAIVKAYTTRVGQGVFPTEDTGSIGQFLQEKGHEFGTVTGRVRRCGWMDGMVLNYGKLINGYTGLVITKLDVLSGLDEVKICEAYRAGGETLTDFPIDSAVFQNSAPVYRTFPGWKEDISNARKMSDLPKTCRAYLSFIEEYTKVPIKYVSVGADRDAMIAA